MKKILFFFVAIALFSCSRSSDGSATEPDNPLYGKDKGGVYVKVSAERKLMSGEKVNEDLKASVVHIWDATNRDFDVQKTLKLKKKVSGFQSSGKMKLVSLPEVQTYPMQKPIMKGLRVKLRRM